MSDKGKKTKDGFTARVVGAADRAGDTEVAEVIRAIPAVAIQAET